MTFFGLKASFHGFKSNFLGLRHCFMLFFLRFQLVKFCDYSLKRACLSSRQTRMHLYLRLLFLLSRKPRNRCQTAPHPVKQNSNGIVDGDDAVCVKILLCYSMYFILNFLYTGFKMVPPIRTLFSCSQESAHEPLCTSNTVFSL